MSAQSIQSLLICGLVSLCIAAVFACTEAADSQTIKHESLESKNDLDVPPPPATADKILKGNVSATESTSKRIQRKQVSNDDLAKLFHQRGIVSMGNSKLNEAQENFEKVLELKPTDTQTIDLLAELCSQNNDTQGSYTYYWLAGRLNQALGITLDPFNRQRQARIKELETTMRAEIAKNGGGNFTTKEWWPRDLEKSINCRAVHLFGMGDTKNALRLFQEVLRLNPNNTDALFNIGAICEERRNYSRAGEYYKAALDRGKLDAGASDALKTLGAKVVQFHGGIEKVDAKLGAQSHFSCALCRILRGQVMNCN